MQRAHRKSSNNRRQSVSINHHRKSSQHAKGILAVSSIQSPQHYHGQTSHIPHSQAHSRRLLPTRSSPSPCGESGMPRRALNWTQHRSFTSAPEIPIVSHPLPDVAMPESGPTGDSPAGSTSRTCGTNPSSHTITKSHTKKQLMGFTLPELQTEFQELGLEKYRAKQVFEWVYKHGATSFDEMTNIKKQHIDTLHDHFTIYPINIRHIARADDGTRKYVVGIEKKRNKGDTIETVFIPRVFEKVHDSRRDRYDRGGHYHDDDEDEHGTTSVNYDVNSFLQHTSLLPSKNGDELGIFNPRDLLTSSSSNSKRKSNGDDIHSGEDAIIDEDFSQHAFDKYRYTKGTVCVSSQVGCSLACTFCHTGTMPKSELRNLTSAEIISQLMVIKQDLNDFTLKRAPSKDPLPTIASNIVFMGMGEPLYNYNNVAKALDVMLDPHGLHFGRRHLTVSTSGVVPMIDRLGAGPCVNLAISLHAVTNELRDQIVPINKLFPLEVLLAACRDYPGVKNTRKITWEYVMLNGVNDSEADARELLRLTKGIPSLVNLIPFNPWPGSQYTCSSMNRMKRFQEIINNTTSTTGIRATIRNTTGQSEMGGCGMLNSKIKAESNFIDSSALTM